MHAPMRGWCAARAMWNRENTGGVSRAESDCQRLAGVLHVAVALLLTILVIDFSLAFLRSGKAKAD